MKKDFMGNWAEWMQLSTEEKRIRMGLRIITPEESERTRRRNRERRQAREELRRLKENKSRKREERLESLKIREEINMNNPSKVERRRMLTYGLKLGQWERLFIKQGKCCSICKSTTPGAAQWHTDHCHLTDKVRGILCQTCNNGLGMFADDVTRLQGAVEYLINPPFSEDI